MNRNSRRRGKNDKSHERCGIGTKDEDKFAQDFCIDTALHTTGRKFEEKNGQKIAEPNKPEYLKNRLPRIAFAQNG